jgi:hypothetical protein
VKCNHCGHVKRHSKPGGCPAGHVGGFTYFRPIDAPKPAEHSAAPLPHQYEVHLPPDGDNVTFVGFVFAPSLAEAKRLAPIVLVDSVRLGTPLEVRPCRDKLDPTGVIVDIAECATCGHRWPASEGVGCPTCVHGPLPDLAAEAAPVDVEAPASGKPARKTFKVMYRWDDDEPPMFVEELKAANFDEARAMLPMAYKFESILLPDDRTVKIDFDRLELVQVPAKPRAKKEATVG